MPLRPYQQEAVDKIFEAFAESRSALCVSPTGTGKTQIFSEVVRRFHPKRSIILAHREELITQAYHRIKQFGLNPDVEMSDQYAAEHAFVKPDVVISTVQTQVAGRNRSRMERFNPFDFELVVCDEAHHYTADSFRRVLEYYKQNPALKILGVTATPDRADEEALGQVFETVAFDYEILDAIHDGWLVPVDQQMIVIEGLDFSQVRTTAGDLNGADLAKIMEIEENLQGVASASMKIIPEGRRALAFTVSVKQAELLSEIFNRHRPNSASWICGATPKADRKDILDKFRSGETHILCNVGVLTEGLDVPEVETVIQARPTKSRCLYAQIVGRALRPLPGLVDELSSPDERRKAIELSPKPSALILDFVGNSGRHKLITTADILGGNVSDEAIERAATKARAEGKAVRMDALLEDEEHNWLAEREERRRLEAARKARIVGHATYRTVSIDPFSAFGIQRPSVERGWDKGKRLSTKQDGYLRKSGINPDLYTYVENKRLIDQSFYRMNQGLCSLKQMAFFQKRGVDASKMSFEEASAKITEIANREGWGKKNGR